MRGKTTGFIVEEDTTIEELYYKYMDNAPLYGNNINNVNFRVNGMNLKQHDKTKIKDYFKNQMGGGSLPIITVFFVKDVTN